jgi:hypothetical protein
MAAGWRVIASGLCEQITEVYNDKARQKQFAHTYHPPGEVGNAESASAVHNQVLKKGFQFNPDGLLQQHVDRYNDSSTPAYAACSGFNAMMINDDAQLLERFGFVTYSKTSCREYMDTKHNVFSTAIMEAKDYYQRIPDAYSFGFGAL